jgi:hypothetical protein
MKAICLKRHYAVKGMYRLGHVIPQAR